MVIGTVIPQHQSLGRYIGLYGKYAGRVITFLGLGDAFHSILFNTLMGLFGVNLLVCSLSRFNQLKSLLFSPRVEREKGWIEGLKDSTTSEVEPDKREELINKAKALLGDRNYESFSEEKESKRYFLFQKGKWGRLGPDVVHLSIIIILIGGIISGLSGFSTTVEVTEGQTKSIPRTQHSVKLNDFSISYYKNKYRLDLYRQANGSFKHDKQLVLNQGKPETYKDLKLLIRTQKKENSNSEKLLFTARKREEEQTIEFSGQRKEVMLPGNVGAILSRFIKQYTSRVEVMDSEGNVVQKATVQVNSPLSVSKVKLYQQAYELGTQKVPNPRWVSLEAYRGGEESGAKPVWKGRVKLGEEVEITEGTTIVATRFYPNLTINQSGEAVNISAVPENPSVYIEVKKNQLSGKDSPQTTSGQDLSRWIFQRYGDIHYSSIVGKDREALRFKLTDFGPVIESKDKTIFKVSNQPGINLIYLGSGLLMLGLALSFFVFHRRIWIVFDKDTGEVSIGGKCRKEIQNFHEDLEDLFDLLGGRKE